MVVSYLLFMLMISNDVSEIEEAKEYLKKHFITKNMRKPKYFMGIKFTYNKRGLVPSQRKYVNDLLQKTKLPRCTLARFLR